MKALKKRRYWLLLLILVPVLVMAAAANYAAAQQPVKVGFAGSLTAFNSDLGISGRNGALLAVRDVNEAGGVLGKKLLLVTKDDHNDPEEALAVDTEFQREGIRLIVGHMTSQMAKKSVQFVNDNHLLMMSPTISLDSLSGQDDFFFRVIPTNKTQAKALCDRMIADGVRKVSIIIDEKNLLFTATLRDFFVEYFQSAGGQVLCNSEFESVDTMDASIKTIKSDQPQGVLVIAASESVALLSQKLFQLGMHIRLYGPAWAMTPALLEHGGSTVEGAQFANYFDNTSQAPQYARFRYNYLHAYGNEPSFASYLSYESIEVLAQAMGACGSADPDALRQYINKQKSFDGLEGTIQFNEFGDVDTAVLMYQVKDGQFQIVK